jgi:hypothetical protein
MTGFDWIAGVVLNLIIKTKTVKMREFKIV